MILQALADYYERKPKVGEANDGLAPLGMEENNIGFVIVLDKAGTALNIEDLRVQVGRQKKGRATIVPGSCDRTGTRAWETAFLLWDYPRYVLGVIGEKDKSEMAEKRIGSFRHALEVAFPDPSIDPGVLAVNRFYERFDENLLQIKAHSLWPELESTTYGVSFRLSDVAGQLVCQSSLVVARARELYELDPSAPVAQCLISGDTTAIQVLHSATPLPLAASKSTAKILSFNERAYESYGKRERQGENAPVGKGAAFAYTTALNHLLSRQRLRVSDSAFVYWAARETSFENDFAAFFDEPPPDNPDAGAAMVEALFAAAEQGVGPVLVDQTRFFVLGLAPNSARIAIRFWHVGTVAEMAGRIVRHFRDLEIVRHPEAKPFLSIKTLLTVTAVQGDSDNIPPNLGGELMRSILHGLPYPETLFSAAVRRIRAEQSARDKRSGKLLMNVTYARAALLKACLNRKPFPNEKEITVSLDKDNTNPGYRLGRLFAVLEQVQKEAGGDMNATIRDRYYGAFSAMPASVYPVLIRLSKHHLSKLGKDNPGRRTNLDNLIGEITNELPASGPPAILSLQDQGRFAIGYYHQRMDPGTYRNTNNSKENDNG